MFNINFIRRKNVDRDVSRKLSLLILHSFFSGLFVSVFFSIANIGFVKNFGSQYLPYGYLISGFIGYLLIQGYRKILKRGGYKAFLIGLLALLILTITFRGIMFYNNEFVFKVMSFVIFLFAMPFLSLSWLEQSGLILKTLDYRETKKYSGIINSGATIASIIGYLLVPQILPKLANIYDVLIIAIAGLIIAIVFLAQIRKYIKNDFDYVSINQAEGTAVKEKSLAELFKRPYILYIAICSGISMMAFYLIDFSFLINAKKNTNSTAELAGLLSTFFAAIKLFELILSLSSAKIFRIYGLKIGIFILPLLCLFFSVASFLSYYFLQSIVFVIAIFILKLFERVVNKSIEEPAYKSLYQLLPINERLSIQARIDGGTKQLFIILAGIVLILFNLITPINYLDIGLLFFTIPLFTYWLISSKKLVMLFRRQLMEILEPTDSKKIKINSKSHKDRLNSVVSGLDSEKNEESLILNILKNKLKVEKEKNALEEKVLNADSDYFEEQLEAPILLFFPKQDNFSIRQISATKEDAFINQLMSDELPSDEYLNTLIKELKNCKSDYERKLILNLFEKSNSEYSFTGLLDLVDYPDYYFKNDVIACLKSKNFKSNSKTEVYFENIIEDTLFDLTFIISLISSINNDEKHQLIQQALYEEELALQKRLLSILSWKHDMSSLNIIEEALFGKQKLYSSSNIDIALELLDILIDNNLRSKISLALEGGNYNNRFIKLSNWYFVPKEQSDDAVILILNYDYNKIGVWTKACAIKTLLQFPNEKFRKATAGYTYHSNLFLRALAFEYQEIINGQSNYILLPKENSFFKKEEALNNINRGTELFNLVIYLREHKIFSKVSSNHLVKLIYKAEINKTDKKIIVNGSTSNVFNLIIDGKLAMQYEGAFPKQLFTKNYLSGSMFGGQKITEVSIFTNSLFYQIPASSLVDFILSSEDTINYLVKRKF